MRAKNWPTCTCSPHLGLYQVGMHGGTKLTLWSILNFYLFSTYISDTVPCPGGYKKYRAAKVLETGYWSFQCMGGKKGKEQRERTIQSCPRSQIAQKYLKILKKKKRKTQKQVQVQEVKAHTQNGRFRECAFLGTGNVAGMHWKRQIPLMCTQNIY